jgi:hypothetical protein
MHCVGAAEEAVERVLSSGLGFVGEECVRFRERVNARLKGRVAVCEGTKIGGGEDGQLCSPFHSDALGLRCGHSDTSPEDNDVQNNALFGFEIAHRARSCRVVHLG